LPTDLNKYVYIRGQGKQVEEVEKVNLNMTIKTTSKQAFLSNWSNMKNKRTEEGKIASF
jgi:hypothetical protein